jgi:hypothetical protein
MCQAAAQYDNIGILAGILMRPWALRDMTMMGILVAEKDRKNKL